MLEINERILRPQPGAHFLSRHDFARSFQKQGQQLNGLPVKFHPESATTQLTDTRIELKDAEAHDSEPVFRTAYAHYPQKYLSKGNDNLAIQNYITVSTLWNIKS